MDVTCKVCDLYVLKKIGDGVQGETFKALFRNQNACVKYFHEYEEMK